MTASLSELLDLKDYTDRVVHEHKLPAASIAVWKDNQLHEAASGILNLNTGVDATTDAIFQVGSITKVMTASLLMKLVDAGRVELDVPVKHYLHDFIIADSVATEQITVRQLLNHTSGIEGDFLPDDHGHQGNLIARFVDRCNFLPLIHPVGSRYSYCNTGFGIAGRLIEVLTGLSWFQAMEQLLFQPLGMDHAIVNPAEAIRFRTAVGHVYEGERCRLADRTYLPMGMAPIGACATMRAKDLITFGRAHLENGCNQRGEPWLSAASTLEMQTPQIALPRLSQVSRKHAGIAWAITDYEQAHCESSALRVIDHMGATSGSLSLLRIIPEQQSAFAILMNGFNLPALAQVANDLLQSVAGIAIQEPTPPRLEDLDFSLAPLQGVYESLDARIDVKVKQSRSNAVELKARVTPKIDPLPPQTLILKPYDPSCVAAFTESGERSAPFAFVEPNAAGQPQYVMYGGRLNKRVSDE